jgi:lysophospholipase L1-like esterase
MGSDGLWTGASVGYLTKAQADAVLAAQATKATLKAGVPAQVDGGPVTWRGAGSGGWVRVSQIEQYHPGDICIFGNSIIGQNGGGYALNLNTYYNSVGFCVLAAIRLNGRVRIVENLGVGGENSAGLVARLNQLKQTSAGTVVVMESTNDATLGVSAETVFPRYLQIADSCASVGKKCVICTGIPRTTMTEAYKTFYTELRALILSNAGEKYVACDTYPAILESGTGAAISGTLQDGVHPNSTGALLISSPLVETLKNLVPERDIMRYPVSLGRNKLAGQFFEGSGTSVPTGWSVQSAPTGGWTYAARPDSTGKLSAVASGDFVLNQNVTLTQVGRTIRGYLKMKITGLNPAPGANSQRVTFVVQCYNGSSFTEKAFPAYWDTGAGYGNLALEGEVEFRTNPIEIPTGTTLVQASISAGGGGGTYQLLHAYVGDDVE